jgi:flagellar basal body P-ring formation protein FlgA
MLAMHGIILPGLALAALTGACLAEDSAAVVRTAIYPGQQIEAAKVAIVDATNCFNCAPGFVRDPNDVIGMIAVKTILPDRLIYPELLRKPSLIKSGQQVSVLFRLGALSIAMRGETLADANAGETVAVRNKANGTIVTGRVAQDGSILMDPS